MKKTTAFIISAVLLCLCACFVACAGQDEITGVTLADKTVDYDGAKHSLAVVGELPKGAQVNYVYCLQGSESAIGSDGVTDVGTYDVKAIVTCDGYKPLQLSATLVIKGKKFDSNVSMPNSSVNYTGNKHCLTVTGTLPEGTEVVYSYNGVITDGVTDVGEYTVKATVSKAGYETIVITRTLVILALHFPDMSLADKTVVYDGAEHKLELNIDVNSLPGNVGITVTYNGEQAHGATEAGVYEVKWVVSCEGYETVTLTGTLIIQSLD
ncbi:MAG: MBG domain-containing protein [Corallococcus sp.]|nr:MBG domain-containing protein [Corallococcus sp.]MCM1359614.1 MBG domain-containing protein [Corallococcus sp.]MCM1395206.1 MBG domain-containing protein [Corallococcus sp.]